MTALTDYLEGKFLDHLFGKATFSTPSVYVGLSQADPGEDGTGVSEPSGGSYARVSTAPADWTRSANTMSNSGEIVFPTATGDWGTITHFFLADASSGGNILVKGALTTTKAVTTDDIAKFPAGDLSLSLD